MVGAVAGSPGTLPTNWTSGGTGTLTRTFSVGTESGLSYIDVRYAGTASTAAATINFETLGQIAAAAGQSYTLSSYFRYVNGSANSVLFAWDEYNGATYLTSKATTITIGSSLTRFPFTATTTATCNIVQPFVRFNLTVGATYDFTIRIAAPQMELGAYATTFIPTTTAAVTRLADAFSRNNLFTNNIVTASGGTWFIDLAGNLSIQRDGAGNGIFLGDSTTVNTGNQFIIRNAVSSGIARYSILGYVGGVLQSYAASSTDRIKVAYKWNGSTVDIFLNGSKIVSASSFTATNLQNLIGTGSVTPFYINQSSLSPFPLTDAQCIQLTT
jgi:hypothetical protein